MIMKSKETIELRLILEYFSTDLWVWYCRAWTESNFQQSALAFHLLKEILEKSGKMFKDSSIFINAMRLHLFNAIKDSGISQNLEIFKLEVEILMIIMKKFHDVLSEEIRVRNVFEMLNIYNFRHCFNFSSHPFYRIFGTYLYFPCLSSPMLNHFQVIVPK